MIAPARSIRSRKRSPAWHAGFLAMLPAIVRHARVAFRHLNPEARADAVQEVVANTLVAYARLVELRKTALAYPSVLARYGVAQFHDGRRIGGRRNVRDVLSEHCQRRKGLAVERLDKYDEDEGVWQEAVVQDTRTAPVPDIVSFRVDFSDWLHDLPHRNRRIAESLALGHTTGEVANKIGVSSGRVSQLRREFHDAWEQFQGEHTTPQPVNGSAH